MASKDASQFNLGFIPFLKHIQRNRLVKNSHSKKAPLCIVLHSAQLLVDATVATCPTYHRLNTVSALTNCIYYSRTTKPVNNKKLSYPQRKCASNVGILYGADGISI